MKEYTKRDSCMTMEEVIERNTGMSLKAFLTPQPNPYIHNMDRAVEFFKKKVNDAAEEKEILQIKIVGDYDADGMNASAILYDAYDSGQPVCAGCFIKGGKILKDGVTNGKEICLDNTGKFYTPSAGISASTLLASGVKDIWGTADPLLIQDGQKVDLANQQKINNTYYNRTAIGMVQPGEYYMITAGTAQYKNGLSFAELQSIFANLGCTYARSMDGGGSSSLVVNGKLLNTPAQYDERPVVDFLSFLP